MHAELHFIAASLSARFYKNLFSIQSEKFLAAERLALLFTPDFFAPPFMCPLYSFFDSILRMECPQCAASRHE